MAFIRRLRNQNWLFPPSIANLINEDHICRLVDEAVESILETLKRAKSNLKRFKMNLKHREKIL